MSESDLAVLLAQLPPGPFYIGHRSTDYLSSNCTTATSNPTSPVSAFLPSSSPAQSIMRRPRPSTLPASIPGQNSIPSSSKLPPPIQTEQIQSSAQSTSSAPSLQVRSDLTRRGSIVSISTEQDILDLADLLSPTIDVDDDDISVAQLATAQVFPDVRRASTSTYSMPHRFSVDSHMTSSSVISSVSSPSVDSLTFDDQRSEDYCESAYLSPSSTSFTPFHLPHLRRHKYRSDTPSLTNSDAHSTISIPTPPLSRTSSFQQGLMTPPVSPLSLSYQPTIIEASIAGLDVIHERRNSEDADVVIKGEQLGSSFEDANMGSTSEHQSAMWERRAVQELGKLRIQTESPETIVPSGPASSVSSGDTASNHGLNTPQHRSSALSRLFQKNAKSTDRITDPNSSTLDLKLQKAEEKRRKKQLAKERTERLAQDLKQRAKSRGAAEETRSIRSAGGSSDGKKQNPAWEEEGGMYNGLGW
ncbi:hypothetical protein PHLCEN_2v5593 [Hermanssonia centrifuga]|uniref:Uncharacterized protein n=1 Tax=Hermanssonia centrifuga TaxID=98765 RepID=A0A2R6P2I6_9APHY|nr:hypothetical protein PHLCEN_2v5593 [Hermanssonia centrifuga]